MQPEISLPDTEGPARHLSAIQSLSAKHQIPVDVIAELYTSEWNLLWKNARLTEYLSVFVSRRVSALLCDLESATSAGLEPLKK